MANIKTPNQKKAYKDLSKRLNQYTKKVLAIYTMLAKEAASIALSEGYDGNDEFLFANYPKTKRKIKSLLDFFYQNMKALVYSGISDEWENSNTLQDLLVRRVMKAYTKRIGQKRVTEYYEKNNAAKEAFKHRTINGLNLSQRIWNQQEDVKKSLERALSTGIEKGMSAVKLSKRVSKYLNDYPSLAKDYKKKYGKAVDVSGCEYRSVRLARNEINMSYRAAEQARWRNLDFVKGIEIKTSGSHPKEDMCDILAGKYPATFNWYGWHVNCMCYAIPIIMSEEEYWSGKQQTNTMPGNFDGWMRQNSNKVNKSSYIIRYAEEVKKESLVNLSAPKVNKKKSDLKEFIKKTVANKFKEVKIETGETARRLYLSNNGEEYVVGKTFLTETMAKNIRNRKLSETLQVASEVNEWFQDAKFERIENGEHHDFKFKVFSATYKGKKIECKVKLTKENILYTMRFIE